MVAEICFGIEAIIPSRWKYGTLFKKLKVTSILLNPLQFHRVRFLTYRLWIFHFTSTNGIIVNHCFDLFYDKRMEFLRFSSRVYGVLHTPEGSRSSSNGTRVLRRFLPIFLPFTTDETIDQILHLKMRMKNNRAFEKSGNFDSKEQSKEFRHCISTNRNEWVRTCPNSLESISDCDHMEPHATLLEVWTWSWFNVAIKCNKISSRNM